MIYEYSKTEYSSTWLIKQGKAGITITVYDDGSLFADKYRKAGDWSIVKYNTTKPDRDPDTPHSIIEDIFTSKITIE